MQYSRRILAAVTLSLIITVCVSVTTESVRGYLLFAWQIHEGEQFVYDVAVRGFSRTGSTPTTFALAVLNNTRVSIEIISLPASAIILDGQTFAQYIIEHTKTFIRFENGTPIPAGLYFELNPLASRSFLPRGPWDCLDDFFPDWLAQPANETVESYISHFLEHGFYVGHTRYSEEQANGWYCVCSTDTGIPSEMVAWAWSLGGLHEYSYNVTLSFVG